MIVVAGVVRAVLIKQCHEGGPVMGAGTQVAKADAVLCCVRKEQGVLYWGVRPLLLLPRSGREYSPPQNSTPGYRLIGKSLYSTILHFIVLG